MLVSGKSLKYDFVRFVSATMASLMVFSLYSMVDGLMVARGVNEYAMSAVNLCIPYTNALFSIAVMFAVGSSTLIAFYLAQQKQHETAAVLLFREPFARLLGADELTMGYVKEYLLGLVPFSVCFLISYNLEVLVKTDGYPRFAMFTVITGCLANCVMDYIAIFWMDLGAFGAAAATGLSQLLTCLLYFIHFFGRKCTFRLRKFRFDPHIYRRLLPIGFSDGITELCTGVMIFLFNRTILRCIGTDGVVTYTVIAYVNTLMINVFIGISQGSQPLVSYHYGKGETRESLRLLRYGITAVCCIAPTAFAGLWLFAPAIVKAYLSQADGALAAYSVVAFRRYSVSYLMVGFNVVIGGFMTAIERPFPAASISMGRGLVLQAGALLALAALWGGEAIWFAPVISEAVCLVMALAFMVRFWKSNRTLAAA